MLQRNSEAFRGYLHYRGHEVYLFDAATEIDGADVAIELDAKRAIDQRSRLAAGLTRFESRSFEIRYNPRFHGESDRLGK